MMRPLVMDIWAVCPGQRRLREAAFHPTYHLDAQFNPALKNIYGWHFAL